MSIYFLSCSQYIWKVRERELTGKWLGRRCRLEMLGSGADRGIAGVDRSLGERNGGWWVAPWWRWRWFGVKVVAVKASQQHQDFLKILRIRENRGEDCGVKSWRERYEHWACHLLSLLYPTFNTHFLHFIPTPIAPFFLFPL